MQLQGNRKLIAILTALIGLFVLSALVIINNVNDAAVIIGAIGSVETTVLTVFIYGNKEEHKAANGNV